MPASLEHRARVYRHLESTMVNESAVTTQQLVARIKRSSKYAHQAQKGGWFDVRKINRGYPQVVGNNNAYDRSDVTFGIRLDDGTIVEMK